MLVIATFHTNAGAKEAPIITPLMDFVRQKRAAKSGSLVSFMRLDFFISYFVVEVLSSLCLDVCIYICCLFST